MKIKIRNIKKTLYITVMAVIVTLAACASIAKPADIAIHDFTDLDSSVMPAAFIDIGDGKWPDSIRLAFTQAIKIHDTIVFTGTLDGAQGTLTLNIPAGKKAVWTASLNGSGTGTMLKLIGRGTFDMHSGDILSGGIAINNTSTGAININGGTVSSVDNIAINNVSAGLITISEANPDMPTLITSENFNSAEGTIYLGSLGMSGEAILIMNGGVVTNNGSSGNARAIRNDSRGAVNITGGRVHAPRGRGIDNQGFGTVNISGGTVSSQFGGSSSIHNASFGTVNISGGTVSTDSSWALHMTGNSIVNISGGTVMTRWGRAINAAGSCFITISESDPEVPTLISSTNGSTGIGTITLLGTSRLVINGGKIMDTADSENSCGIYSSSKGSIHISGAHTSILAQSHPEALAIFRSTDEAGEVFIAADVPEENISNRGSINWTK